MHRYLQKRIIILIITLLALGLTSCRQEEAAQHKSPLWKVTSGRASVYLLGSIHLLKKSDYPLSKAIENAFAASDIVVFELDFTEATSLKAQSFILEASTFNDSRTLQSVMMPDTYSKLETIFSERGMDINRASNFKPWAIATMLTVAELERKGFKTHYGVDMHYYSRARDEGKEIKAFETLKYQIGIFNSMSMEDQDAFVLQTINEISTIYAEFNGLVSSWKRGETSAIEKMIEPCREIKNTCDILIDQRNINWLSQIDEFLNDKKTYMIIVGAGHMVGENGLIELLRKEGHNVKQL